MSHLLLYIYLRVYCLSVHWRTVSYEWLFEFCANSTVRQKQHAHNQCVQVPCAQITKCANSNVRNYDVRKFDVRKWQLRKFSVRKRKSPNYYYSNLIVFYTYCVIHLMYCIVLNTHTHSLRWLFYWIEIHIGGLSVRQG